MTRRTAKRSERARSTHGNGARRPSPSQHTEWAGLDGRWTRSELDGSKEEVGAEQRKRFRDQPAGDRNCHREPLNGGYGGCAFVVSKATSPIGGSTGAAKQVQCDFVSTLTYSTLYVSQSALSMVCISAASAVHPAAV